jgi:arylsulfatase A-like enzyme
MTFPLPRLLLIGMLPVLTAGWIDRAFGERPNVLVIITDDQRTDAVGLGGSRHLQTPNIDRLGKEGIYFANMFCTTSLCSPSRASILSGLYAHTHGVTDNFTEYPEELKSFPIVLHDEGYDTAYVGKWHMGEDNDDPRPGFNWFVTHKGQGKYFDTEFNFHGQRREVVPGYYTHVVTDMAIDWLNRPRGDKPWLLMVGHKAPHSFYYPEPKYENAFDHVRISVSRDGFHAGR